MSASRLIVLTGLAIVARAVTFGNPIVHVDEEFYYVVARAMTHGALPYIHIWDRKPFGLFLLYLPAGLFAPPLGIYVYQALALAAVIGTALIVARIADRAGWSRGATVAAALYILWLDLADGQGGQAPVFYNLFTAGAALLIVDHLTDRGGIARWRAFAAMALIGCALQIKYSVVFEGIAFGLWLAWTEWRRRRSVAAVLVSAMALCAIALLPTALVAAGYWIGGYGPQFLYANVFSIAARHADPIDESLANLATGLGLLAPLLVLSIIGPARSAPDPTRSQTITFVRLWLATAVFAFLIFGSWFNHYTLPVMLPAAICTAGFIAKRRSGLAVGLALILFVFVAGQIILQAERKTRGTPAQFAAIARAIGTGPGALYVYQGSAMLYPMTGRPALTRYIFPTHLMFAREQGAVGVDQGAEIERIFDARPEVVVLQSPDEGEDLSKRAIALRRIAGGNYRRTARLPLGNRTFDILRAR